MNVAFAADDPGGADCLVPIVRSIKANTRCVLANKAKDVFETAHLPYVDGTACSINELSVAMKAFRPNVVVTGTSMGPSLDKKMIDYAKNHHIPCISIVDYWSNYWMRFQQDGRKCIPDVICITDTIMQEEMIVESFPPSLLKITGNPAFSMYDLSPAESEEDCILFVSQPLSKTPDVKRDIGYDEYDALALLLDSLPQDSRVIVRLHPREEEGKFDHLLKMHQGKVLATTDQSSDISDLIRKSKIIIGMSSVVLFRSYLMGKKTISLQPSVKKDLSILHKLGLLDTAASTKELIAELDAPKHHLDLAAKRLVRADATENILQIITSLAQAK